MDTVICDLKDRLKTDIKDKRNCEDVTVSADMTRNLYRMSGAQYKPLLCTNITKKYMPPPGAGHEAINAEAKAEGAAMVLGIEDRMERLDKYQRFVTSMDQRDGFADSLQY
eukprot:scpid103018/ scgid10793/ 